MNIHLDIGQLAAIVLASLALATVAYQHIVEINTIKVKLGIVWDFLMRRGKAESVFGGWAETNSPIRINETGRKAVEPLLKDVKEHLATIKRSMTDAERMFEIEHVFGERLLYEVCLPNKMALGACLFLLVEAIKEDEAEVT